MAKRIGLIDNLLDVENFLLRKYHAASAADVMAATGGNTGNVAFVFGTRQILKGPMTRIHWETPAEIVRSQFDHLVVCCANQIGAHADLGYWAERLELFGLPVTLLGLGAQSENYLMVPKIPKGTKHFLHVVTQLRSMPDKPNIGVRGEFTQRVLGEVGVQTVRTGCPSLFIAASRDLGARILCRQGVGELKRVAIAAGNPWHRASAFLERLLVDIVDRYSGAYILQHDESMLQIAYGETDRISPETVTRFLDVYGDRFDSESMLLWYRRNACAFVDAANWMRHLGQFDAVIGPRYHGVALALQTGVPGCVFTIDSRTKELCDETAVKSIDADELRGKSAEELLDLSRWTEGDAMRFDDRRREKAAAVAEFLAISGLLPSDHLNELAKA